MNTKIRNALTFVYFGSAKSLFLELGFSQIDMMKTLHL